MRKKKQTISEKENNSFSYIGELNISLLKNNKVIKTKKYKNKGRWPLFYFFSQCLGGNYKNALLYRPQYLVLYYAGAKNTDTPIIGDGEGNIGLYAKEENKMTSGLIQVVETPVITKTENNIGSSNINFHFEIPFSYLNLQREEGDTNWKPINLIALYCANFVPTESTNLNQPSNFCFIESNGKLGDLLTELNVTTDQSRYSLKIEWTLSIIN